MTTTTLHIDPRIRARRIAVLREQGRRRLRVVLVGVCAVLVGAGAWGLTLTPAMDIDRITISGTAAARTDEILERAQMRTGLPMAFLDVDETEKAVSALPWVKSARVRRDWPATVRIDVVPRVPAAVVPTGTGRTALIDASGYVIGWTASTSAEAVLVHLSVPFNGSLGGIHTAADGPLAVAAAMPDDLRDWVSTVTVDPAGEELGLELSGGAAVILGEAVLLEAKMSAVRSVLAGTDLECVTEIDVTMPDIATVRRHPACRR